MHNPDIKIASDLLDEFLDRALAGLKPSAAEYLGRCGTDAVRQSFLGMAFALATLGNSGHDSPSPDDGEAHNVMVINFLEALSARAA